MQTRKINKEFFKKNNLTLSHLNEMLDEQVIEENKFKSMLAALLLGLMPNTKADTLPSNSVTVQNVTNPLLNITDRSATTSQNLLRAKNPNPAEIANIKVKIDADLMGGKKAEKTRDTVYTEIFPIKGMPFMSHLTVYETPEEIDQLAAKNKMALTGQEEVL